MANTSQKPPRPAQDDAKSSAKPAAKFRFGDVSAAVFAEPVNLPSGKTITLFNVSLRRSYRDRETGNWKQTNVLSHADLLPAAEVLRACYHAIEEMR